MPTSMQVTSHTIQHVKNSSTLPTYLPQATQPIFPSWGWCHHYWYITPLLGAWYMVRGMA